MTNPDPKPRNTIPGWGPTPRFDIPLPLLLPSLPLLVFFLVLVPPGGFATEATEANFGSTVLNTFAMATAIRDGDRRSATAIGDGDWQQCGPPPSSTGEPCVISYLGCIFFNNSGGGMAAMAAATTTAKDSGGHGLQMQRQQQKRRNVNSDGDGGWVDKDNGGDGSRDGRAARVTKIMVDVEIDVERGRDRERDRERLSAHSLHLLVINQQSRSAVINSLAPLAHRLKTFFPCR